MSISRAGAISLSLLVSLASGCYDFGSLSSHYGAGEDQAVNFDLAGNATTDQGDFDQAQPPMDFALADLTGSPIDLGAAPL